MRIVSSSAFIIVAALTLSACNTTTMQATESSPTVARTQGSVNVGYIAVAAGFDIEARIGHMPSSAQIVWLHQNYAQLERQGAVATGARIEIVAYGNNNSEVIWSDVTTSTGQRRAQMPKAVMAATDVICARVTGYRIVNVENVQLSRDGNSTSWCQYEFAEYVNAPWMQGASGGYGFPLILEEIR